MVLTDKNNPLGRFGDLCIYFFNYISRNDRQGQMKSMRINTDDGNGSQFFRLFKPWRVILETLLPDLGGGLTTNFGSQFCSSASTNVE